MSPRASVEHEKSVKYVHYIDTIFLMTGLISYDTMLCTYWIFPIFLIVSIFLISYYVNTTYITRNKKREHEKSTILTQFYIIEELDLVDLFDPLRELLPGIVGRLPRLVVPIFLADVEVLLTLLGSKMARPISFDGASYANEDARRLLLV